MGQFSIQIQAHGAHGCERRAQGGEKLFNRCSKLTCADCLTFDFVQTLRVKGFQVDLARFVHHPGARQEVEDDLLLNERKRGAF